MASGNFESKSRVFLPRSTKILLVLCNYSHFLQNLAQSGLPHPGASITERVAFMNGPMGLMRGMYPGDCSFKRRIALLYKLYKLRCVDLFAV